MSRLEDDLRTLREVNLALHDTREHGMRIHARLQLIWDEVLAAGTRETAFKCLVEGWGSIQMDLKPVKEAHAGASLYFVEIKNHMVKMLEAREFLAA